MADIHNVWVLIGFDVTEKEQRVLGVFKERDRATEELKKLAKFWDRIDLKWMPLQ